jgi:hypothetical protein
MWVSLNKRSLRLGGYHEGTGWSSEADNLYRVFYSFKKFKEYQEFENLYYEI